MRKHYRFIRPRLYRYRVADPGLRVTVNRYSDEPPIGLAVVVGHYAYCVLWAKTRAKTPWERAAEVVDEVGRSL